MTTAADLINTVHRRLQNNNREVALTLNGGVGANAGTLTLNDLTGQSMNAITPGSVLSCELELYYVESKSASTVNVIPAFRGSTSASHTSGALVWVNPRFSDFDILTALNEDLNDLCGPACGLFQLQAFEFTYMPPYQGFDLGSAPSPIMEIVQVRYRTAYPTRNWVPIPRGEWEFDPNADTTDFPSGNSLTLYDGGFPGQPVRVTYKGAFGQLAAYTDNVVTSCGLPSTAVDLPPLGAEVILVSPKEVKRNQTEGQGDPRIATETPAGSVQNSVAGIKDQRQRRINAEKLRLQRQIGSLRTRV